MKISPYLFFDGNCREAVAHYEKAFGVTACINNSAENPDIVEHAQISLKPDGAPIMFCDWEEPFAKGQDVMISINFEDDDKPVVTTAFDVLAEGGKVVYPLGEQQWSKCAGIVVDKFGFRWNFYQM